jgi:hypothetical protein
MRFMLHRASDRPCRLDLTTSEWKMNEEARDVLDLHLHEDDEESFGSFIGYLAIMHILVLLSHVCSNQLQSCHRCLSMLHVYCWYDCMAVARD